MRKAVNEILNMKNNFISVNYSKIIDSSGYMYVLIEKVDISKVRRIYH